MDKRPISDVCGRESATAAVATLKAPEGAPMHLDAHKW